MTAIHLHTTRPWPSGVVFAECIRCSHSNAVKQIGRWSVEGVCTCAALSRDSLPNSDLPHKLSPQKIGLVKLAKWNHCNFNNSRVASPCSMSIPEFSFVIDHAARGVRAECCAKKDGAIATPAHSDPMDRMPRQNCIPMLAPLGPQRPRHL